MESGRANLAKCARSLRSAAHMHDDAHMRTLNSVAACRKIAKQAVFEFCT
jgi:hypothetical protein